MKPLPITGRSICSRSLTVRSGRDLGCVGSGTSFWLNYFSATSGFVCISSIPPDQKLELECGELGYKHDAENWLTILAKWHVAAGRLSPKVGGVLELFQL